MGKSTKIKSIPKYTAHPLRSYVGVEIPLLMQQTGELQDFLFTGMQTSLERIPFLLKLDPTLLQLFPGCGHIRVLNSVGHFPFQDWFFDYW